MNSRHVAKRRIPPQVLQRSTARDSAWSPRATCSQTLNPGPTMLPGDSTVLVICFLLWFFIFFEEGGRRWKLDSQLASTTGSDLFLVVLNSNLNTMAITFKDKLSPCLSVIVDSQPCGQTDYNARRHVTGDALLQEHLSLCYYLFRGSSTFEISLWATKYSTSVFPYHMGCQTTVQGSIG